MQPNEANFLNVDRVVDSFAERWGKVMIPLYVNKENHSGDAQPIGSAFVAGFRGCPFLVTALHVLKEVRDGAPLVAVIAGQSVLLNRSAFHTDEENDLAGMRLDGETASRIGLKVETLSALAVDALDDCNTIGRFVMLGFPGSQNVLNEKTGHVNRKLFAFSFSEEVRAPKAKTALQNPLVLRFVPKQARDSDGRRVNPPPLNGTSGGPVVELAHSPQGSNAEFKPVFRGVLLEYDKVNREVVVVRRDLVEKLLARIQPHALSAAEHTSDFHRS